MQISNVLVNANNFFCKLGPWGSVVEGFVGLSYKSEESPSHFSCHKKNQQDQSAVWGLEKGKCRLSISKKIRVAICPFLRKVV